VFRNLLVLVVYVVIVVASTGIAAGAASAASVDKLPCGVSIDQVYDRTLIVRFVEGVRSTSALEPYRSISWDRKSDEKFLKPFGWGFTVVRVDDGTDLAEAFSMLANDPLIKDVWPNVIRQPSFVPNDPKYLNERIEGLWTPDRQYYLEMMGAEAAWEKTTGCETVVVAMIDTGADLNHEELVTQLWVNPGEIADNDTDDDNNNYIDDVHGYDFYFKDGNPDDDQDFSAFHGTSTAGIIGARGGNSVGIMGAAGGRGALTERGVRLMILRVGTDMTIKLTAEIEALAYAVDNGADIINMSFGGASGGSVEKDALDGAWSSGLVIVAAAGNEGAGAVGEIDWPAAVDSVIAVGATTIFPDRYPPLGSPRVDETWADYSKTGAELELTAPGTSILTLAGDGEYTGPGNASFTGTSGSCPLVTGLAALIKSANPDLMNAEIRTLMQETAVDMGLAGRDELYGFGRVDYEAALQDAGRVIAGDANGDGFINESDIPEITALFGIQIGDPKYVGRVDCNRDGVIDELDLFPIGMNYGLATD